MMMYYVEKELQDSKKVEGTVFRLNRREISCSRDETFRLGLTDWP